MQPELTLNLKCPSCGSLTPKTLSQIKAQREFDCVCGYHIDLEPLPVVKPPRHQAQRKVASTA